LKFSAARPIPLIGYIRPELFEGSVDPLDLAELLLGGLSAIFDYLICKCLEAESIYIASSPFAKLLF